MCIVLALGDPLIKGLTEVANNRPTDPVQFLANYLQSLSKDKTNVSSRSESIGFWCFFFTEISVLVDASTTSEAGKGTGHEFHTSGQ